MAVSQPEAVPESAVLVDSYESERTFGREVCLYVLADESYAVVHTDGTVEYLPTADDWVNEICWRYEGSPARRLARWPAQATQGLVKH